MPAVVGFIGGMFGFGGGLAAGTALWGGWAAGAGFATTVVGGLTVKLLTTVAFSALQSALGPKPPQGGGLTISTTLRGEDNSETITLGRYATGGQAICPPYSHGPSNRWLTHVIELCSAPGAQLNRLMMGDEWVEIGDTPMAGYEEYGLPILGDKYGGGYIFIKYYDGSQTSADPMLLDKYGSHPDRPWTADMVGTGLCYAILTFYYNQSKLPSVPRYRFELIGIPLYDIRQDSTAGGSGPQRQADPATWAPSDNPMVQAWNVMRGVALPGGEVWGGRMDHLRDLPKSVWVAAMNKCDVAVAIDDGTEPMYRAGIETVLSQPPATALEELLKAASATVADLGHGWGITAGAPPLPIHSFTDDDVLVSRKQELDPFPGLSETYNAVTAKFPDPEHFWETKDAPHRTNADWEAADAFGRRAAALSLPAVPFKFQVQRLMQAWIEDERRFLRHVITLPPDAAHVELTDTVVWTSTRNAYAAKEFSVREILEDPRTGVRQLSLREQNAADWIVPPDYILPTTAAPAPPTVIAATVDGFDADRVILIDGDDVERRGGIRLSWSPAIIGDGLQWQARLAGSTDIVLRGTTQDLADGYLDIFEGVLPDTTYELRAELIVPRPTLPTAWQAVTTPDIRIDLIDLAPAVEATMTATLAAAGEAAADAVAAAASSADALLSKTLAETAATGAAASATSASNAFSSTVMVEGNPSFDDGYTGWRSGTSSGSGALTASHGTLSNSVFTTPAGVRRDPSQNRLHRLPAGRKYQVRIRFAVSGASVIMHCGVQVRDGAGATVSASGPDGRVYNTILGFSYPASATPYEVVSPVFDLTSLKSIYGAHADTEQICLFALLNTGAAADAQVALDGIWLEDVTESQAAASQALIATAALTEQGRTNLVARENVASGQAVPLAWGRAGWGLRMVGTGATLVNQITVGPLEQNTAYSLSFRAKLTAGTSQALDIDLFPDTLPQSAKTITNTEQLFKWEGITSAHADMLLSTVLLRFFRASLASGVTIEITEIKLEKGTTATAWTPSPRDAAASALAASLSADLATTKATEAGGYSAEALSYRNTAARLMSGGVSKNPIFSTWTGADPANVAVILGGTSARNKITTGVRYINAVELVASDTSQNRPILRLNKTTQALDCSISPLAVLIRAEVEFVSGTLAANASLAMTWQAGAGGTAGAVNKTLSALGMQETTGIVQTIEWYVERPATYVAGAAPDFYCDLYARLGATGTCTIRVHRLDFEEILANSATSIYQRSVAQVDEISSAVVGLRAQAGSGGAILELVALDDPTGNPASVARIAAEHIILNGDTTVEGDFEVSGGNIRLTGDTVVDGDFEVTGDMIVSGAVSRKHANTDAPGGGTLTANGTANGIVQGPSSFTVAWAAYDDASFPSNPVIFEANGEVNTASGAGSLIFVIQTWSGSTWSERASIVVRCDATVRNFAVRFPLVASWVSNPPLSNTWRVLAYKTAGSNITMNYVFWTLEQIKK